MIGSSMWRMGKRMIEVWAILFLVGGIGAQAAPVVSSFRINNGAPATMNPAVTLPNVCEGAASATHSYMASESPDFTGAAWKPYAPVPLFILSNTTSGTKTVYFKVKDGANAESSVTSDTITLGGEGYSIVVWGQTQYSPTVPLLNSGFVTIAAGCSHNVALRSDGSITAWLVNSDAYSWGQSDVPEPRNGFVAIAAGGLHSLGLKSDGSVIAWGCTSDGRCSIPLPNSGFVAISGGDTHSLGLKSDGSIVAWGSNNLNGVYVGQCDVPSPNSDYVAVVAGGYHSLGLKSDGSIVGWGNNRNGQCDVPSPNSGFVAIAAGVNHSLGLKSDGTIVSWGSNTNWLGDYRGQCDGPNSNNGFVALAAGGFHSLGLKTDGSITAWGSNVDNWNDYTGQCDVPAPNRNFMAVAGGGNHSLALAVEGQIQVTLGPDEAVAAGAQWRLSTEPEWMSWHNSGDTIQTRIGPHTVIFKEAVGWVKPEDQVVELTTGTIQVRGDYTRLYLTLSTPCSSGTIQTSPAGTRFLYGTTVTLTAQPNPGYWFDRWTGDIPAGYERITPQLITMDKNTTIGATFVADPPPAAPVISAFEINDGTTVTENLVVTLSTTCTAVTSGSAVQCMVSESSDFAGATWSPYGPRRLYMLSRETGDKTVFFKVRNSAGVESAVTSDTIAVVPSKGFPLVTWGGNFRPITVKKPNRDFTAISHSTVGVNTLALKSDGSIVTWGTSLPSPNKDFVAISAGAIHCLGLKSDGSVVAWGNNAYGQCDVPFPSRDFVSIAAGEYCSLGIKPDGSIVAWGSNDWGLCDIPAPNRDFVAVSVGVLNCLGLKSDGSIVLWGQNAASPPTPNRDFKAIAAGYYSALALKSDGSILMRKSATEWSAPFSDKGFVAIASGAQANLGLKSDGSIVMFDGGCIYSNTPSPNTGFVAIAAGGSDFLALANEGDLRVTVTPPEAVAESDARRPLSEMAGQWRLAYEKATVWHKSGDAIRLREKQTITFRDIYGWIKPADQVVEADVSTTVTVTARYTPVTWTLSTTCGANGSLQQSPAGTQFPHGTTVTLTAQPAVGSWFDRWTGDVPAGLERVNPLILTMDANKTIGADFDASAIPSAPVISSFKINNGAATTVNPAVILTNTCTGETSASAAQYLTSESPDFAGATWVPYRSVPLFTLSGGDGVKTVYFKVKNSAEVESTVTSDTISLVGSGASVIVWGGNSHGQGIEPPDNVNFVAVSAGEKHNLGLKSDGSIVAWGGNYAKQCAVPAPNGDFVAISAGYTHSLGLKSDGSVVAWGENGWGQCRVPLPNRDFVAVSAGYYFSLGLKSDGSVVAWGRDDYGQCTVPSSISRCVAISAGAYHCLALKADGSIAAWGNNNYKQCDLPLINRYFVAVSTVKNYGFGLKQNGSMVAIGDPTYSLHQIPTPNLNYTMASVGKGGHCLGLKPDGSIVTWGDNGCSQCNVPAPNIRYLDVSAGEGHSLALLRKNEGSLMVTIAPSEAVAAGARWRLTGKTVWCESATSITCNTGTYTLELLDDLPGWYAQPTTQTVTIEPDELTTATGTYVPGQTWPLSVNAENGTVAKSPSKTNYRAGEIVTLTAMPAARYHFTGWSGDAQGSANPLTLTMDSTKTLTANFAINRYPLTVLAAPQEGGTVASNPQGTVYDSGTVVTLTATPADGYRFVNWTGAATGNNPEIQVTMDSTRTLTANFEPVPVLCSLTVIINPVGSGTVVLSPAGGMYELGTTLTLTVIPAAGYRFVNWTGDATGTAMSVQVLMDGNKTVTANFELLPPCTLTLVADPPEGGTLTKTPELAFYLPGTTVTVSVTPAYGYQFRGWWDGATTVSTETSFVYTMPTMCETLVASFKKLPPDPSTIMVQADPPNGGTVTKSPDQAFYPQGTTVTLTATPSAGYSFVGWYAGAALATTSTSYVLTVGPETFKTAFTAKFRPDNQYTLTLVANPKNSGMVSKLPDQAAYTAGTTVTLTATPAQEYMFDAWMDGATTISTESTFVYTMPAENTTITASFGYIIGHQYTISVVANPPAGGVVSKSPNVSIYQSGQIVTINAVANSGYKFAGWYDGDKQVSTEATYVYTVASMNKTFTAKFALKDSFALTLVADPLNGGVVTKTPDQAGYLAGTPITVSAATAAGYAFRGWMDGSTTISTNNSFEYTMPAENKTLTARFRALCPCAYTVTVVADPANGGTVSKTPDQATYVEGVQLQLNAVAAEGFTFCGWFDGVTTVSTNASCQYTVQRMNKIFTARFEPVVPPTYTVAIVSDPASAGLVSKTPDQAAYTSGTEVVLSAVASDISKWAFHGWVRDADGTTVSETASFTHKVSGDAAFTAKFKPLPEGQYTVTVLADPLNGGSVSKSPNQPTYAQDAEVTIEAVAADGFVFRGWTDGVTTVSQMASFQYVVAEDVIFTAKFKKMGVFTHALTLIANPGSGGMLLKTPDQASYPAGTTVTLTALSARGYRFGGWYDGTTLLSDNTSYTYTMPASARTLTGEFLLAGPLAPTSVTAAGNTYQVRVTWEAAAFATNYGVERTTVGTSATTPVVWTVGAVTEFADDTAVPGVTYSYRLTSVCVLGKSGPPSDPVTASVTPETIASANYKVTARGYTMTRGAANNLTFTPTLVDANPGTIKIALLKKMPANVADNAAGGIYYLKNQGQVSTLAINGDVKTLAFDVPVYSLEAAGRVKSLSARSVTFLKAQEFGSISIMATKASEQGLYARTFIETAGTSPVAMNIRMTGAVVEEVGSTTGAGQPVKLLNVASKVYKDAARVNRTSLGAVGSLPRVVAEIANASAPQSEATPCSIRGSALKAVTVSGGPLVADEMIGLIDKVTASGGNIRCGLIQSGKNLTLIQATSKKINGALVGGAVGTAGAAAEMVVQAQPPVAGKSQVAIMKVYGQTGVAGYFYAGYGDSFQKGGIGTLQTKTGVVEGAAFLDPAQVSKMKVLPKTPVQPIEINPEV